MHDDTSSYRVELDQFSGPMDLLLHLLKEEELEVTEIPIARVCDRYLEHLEHLDRIDIDAAGDFLVMATTLMRLKSRALLPQEERLLDDEDDLDPRFELVRQLIQYRRFKQVAAILEERRAAAARRLPRGMYPELREKGPRRDVQLELDGQGVELLFAAFARLIRETRGGRPYVVTVDDTPIDVHMARLEHLVPVGARVGFRDLMVPGATRAYVIGVFLALLELLKRGRVAVRQDGEFGAFEVEGRECEAPDSADAPTPEPDAG